MSKAILVMEMPENGCHNCALKFDHKCSYSKEDVIGYYGMPFRPKWCPLKPMPEPIKKERYEDDYAMGVRNGFNNCLVEIEELGD